MISDMLKGLADSIIFIYANLGVFIVILIYLYTYNKKTHIQILTILVIFIISSFFIYPNFLVNNYAQKNSVDDFLFFNLLKKTIVTYLVIKLLEYIYYSKKIMWNIPIIFIKLLKVCLIICIFIVLVTFTFANIYKSERLEKRVEQRSSINR